MQSERRFSAFLGVVVTAPRARGYSAFSANYCRCVAHRSSRTRLQRVFRKLLSLCCTPLLTHAVTAFGRKLRLSRTGWPKSAKSYITRCILALERVFRKLLSLCCTPLLAHAVTAHAVQRSATRRHWRSVDRNSFRSPRGECDSGSVQHRLSGSTLARTAIIKDHHFGRCTGGAIPGVFNLVCENCYKRKSYCVNPMPMQNRSFL
jgi:hypothetical protein